MSGKPKYQDVTQVQLRLPIVLKGKIQQASQNTKRSVNEILVEGVGWLFDQPTWPPTTKWESASSSPWDAQLAVLKMLSQESRGRVFMAILKASDAEVTLPAEFREMDQRAKAAWLDENCPLGGE